MKVIIAGSRSFSDYRKLCFHCDKILSRQPFIEVVSGTAKGADTLGERYAKDRGYNLKKFPADWSKHGKSAGVIRNLDMAIYADALIAFYDGHSKGTKNMIDQARKNNLKIRVIYF